MSIVMLFLWGGWVIGFVAGVLSGWWIVGRFDRHDRALDRLVSVAQAAEHTKGGIK